MSAIIAIIGFITGFIAGVVLVVMSGWLLKPDDIKTEEIRSLINGVNDDKDT